MPVCVNCGATYPLRVQIDGKVRNLGSRRYCLGCSPFGVHNTRRIHVSVSLRPCLCCGTGTLNAKFCSNKCQGAYRWGRRKQAITQSGMVPSGARGGYPWVAKRFLLETRGRACEICGGTEWCGRLMPLVLDHIDGNADNWALENLRLVCGNCDMQLPTYKSRNHGKGRAWRRERYAAGLSY